MKILYGVQGTGNGHTTRARVMAKAFEQHDVEVDYLFSGREASDYFDMEAFGNYQTRTGLTFVTQAGKVNGWQTVKQAKVKQFFKDIKEFDLSEYDFVFNDFEPISAWAAKKQKVPVIGMSHQAAFLSPKVPVIGSNILTRTMIRKFAPADFYLGVHWQPFASNIIPPFISQDHHASTPITIKNKVLVYLPFESLGKVVELLKGFPHFEFYCYHPDAQEESLAHIHLRKPSRSGFLTDLCSSSGVIANAGFELSSEALCFGKKLLLKPLEGQFEQSSNAYMLSNIGLAKVMQFLDPDALEDWLLIPNREQVNFPSDPHPLIEWLKQKQWHDMGHLSAQLWQGVKL
ncbi:MJ1255/VC2487 family glycosyltransferase [Pseudoalteromonas ulvae]|uniref:Glycosyltransferase n=1 Tax=Pseudoalteromonas ulvae TaxID=107327 RepID=A0A244CPT1_PSEDV|nr:MJ1255/VC2487 family glycosyltransferase [Pseudoalteromonas ulvae]OUL57614.1 glycosyltransferase [Pseudoalteromonas ulvae]